MTLRPKLIALVLTFIPTYLLGAFVCWSFDPSQWAWIARVVAVLVWCSWFANTLDRMESTS